MSGFGIGPLAITPMAGVGAGDPRLRVHAEASTSAQVSATASSSGALVATSTASTRVAGARVDPALTPATHTARSAGASENRGYPRDTSSAQIELGGLPLERQRATLAGIAALTANPVPYQFSGSATCTATSNLTTGPALFGDVALFSVVSLEATDTEFPPPLSATAMASANAIPAGVGTYPSRSDNMTAELGGLPLERISITASAVATVTADGALTVQGTVTAQATSSVATVPTTFASATVAAEATLTAASASFGQANVSSIAQVMVSGARTLEGAATVVGALSVTIDVTLTQVAESLAEAASSVLATPSVSSSGSSTVLGAGSILVAGLHLRPGDGSAVQGPSRAVILASNERELRFMPGPEIEPTPPGSDPPYDPNFTRVAVLSG